MSDRRPFTLLRAASLVLGSGFVFLTICAAGTYLSASLLSRFDSRDLTRQQTPHEPFYVLVVSETDGRVQPLSLGEAGSGRLPGPGASFSLPVDYGEVETGERARLSYRVMARGPARQEVEVTFRDEQRGTTSRYVVESGRITPVYSRLSRTGYVYDGLRFGLALALALRLLGQIARWIEDRRGRAAGWASASTGQR